MPETVSFGKVSLSGAGAREINLRSPCVDLVDPNLSVVGADAEALSATWKRTNGREGVVLIKLTPTFSTPEGWQRWAIHINFKGADSLVIIPVVAHIAFRDCS